MSSEPQSRARRIAGRIAYWAAVVAIALALVVALILFLESRDKSTIDARLAPGTPAVAASAAQQAAGLARPWAREAPPSSYALTPLGASLVAALAAETPV